ncbi:MAG TPA: LysE family transporter [Nitrososphaera sp.]|nr:LysE family transporter [Nitrososphaera sp.]
MHHTRGVDALAFVAEVVAVSAPGVLAPGPLFVANMIYGAWSGQGRGALSGIKVAQGHAIVEISLIAAIAAGLFSASSFIAGHENVEITIAIIGGLSIIGFALVQIVGIVTSKIGIARKRRTIITSCLQNCIKIESGKGPFATGVMFSALNPFFIVWWLTAGLKLVSDSATFGPLAGPVLLFGTHVWMDYAWLAATAYLASKGSSVIEKSKYYQVLMLGLAALLLYYGAQFLVNGITMI